MKGAMPLGVGATKAAAMGTVAAAETELATETAMATETATAEEDSHDEMPAGVVFGRASSENFIHCQLFIESIML